MANSFAVYKSHRCPGSNSQRGFILKLYRHRPQIASCINSLSFLYCHRFLGRQCKSSVKAHANTKLLSTGLFRQPKCASGRMRSCANLSERLCVLTERVCFLPKVTMLSLPHKRCKRRKAHHPTQKPKSHNSTHVKGNKKITRRQRQPRAKS